MHTYLFLQFLRFQLGGRVVLKLIHAVVKGYVWLCIIMHLLRTVVYDFYDVT